MKKILSALLSVALLLTCLVPAAIAGTDQAGEAAEGTVLARLSELPEPDLPTCPIVRPEGGFSEIGAVEAAQNLQQQVYQRFSAVTQGISPRLADAEAMPEGTLFDTDNWQGAGTASDPFIVSSLAHFQAVALVGLDEDITFEGVYFAMDRDLTYTSADGIWIPIGMNESGFSGTFDGRGFAIRGIRSVDAGLAGFLSGGKVMNVKLIDVGVVSEDAAGAVAIMAEDSVITGCSVEGAVFGTEFVGGIVGGAWSTTISSCQVTGTVSGFMPDESTVVGYALGGVAGALADSRVENCRITELTSLGNHTVGGVAGGMFDGALVRNCAVSGELFGDVEDPTMEGETGFAVGGIVGQQEESTVETSYFQGVTMAAYMVGGITGLLEKGTVKNVYSHAEIAASAAWAGGIVGYVLENGKLTGSYATGEVGAVMDAVGGLIGGFEAVSIANSVALSPAIYSGGDAGRISADAGGTVTNSFALKDMELECADITGTPGQDVTRNTVNRAGFWRDTVQLDGAWTLANGKLPVLAGLAGQSDAMPEHLLPQVDPDDPLGHFVDIEDLWYKPAVSFAVENNLMKGTSATTFAPHTQMSRAMLVTVLGRIAEGMEETITGTADFKDVGGDLLPEYVKYIGWASNAGIVNGYGDGNFGPHNTVTREQAAALILRFAKYMEIELTKGGAIRFTDEAQITSSLYDEVMEAAASGLIRGREDGRFDPRTGCSRAEVSQMFYNFLAE